MTQLEPLTPTRILWHDQLLRERQTHATHRQNPRVAEPTARRMERHMRHATHVDSDCRQSSPGANSAGQPLVECAALCLGSRSDDDSYALSADLFRDGV